MDSLPGLPPEYQLGEAIGRGGMATVFRAFDSRLERPVAIKVLASHLASDHAAVLRFRREAIALARCSHPNVLAVHAIAPPEADPPYIVTELIEGAALDVVLREEGALPWTVAVALIERSLRGLEAAHEQGVLHRDLKPSNILLAAGGVPKISDFGIAYLADHTGLTGEGATMGTLRYIAPESFRSGKPAPTTDVWGMGIILYELLTGAPPFAGGTSHQIMMAIVAGERDPLRVRNPDLPAAVEALVDRALAQDPEARWTTATEMRKACQGLLFENGVSDAEELLAARWKGLRSGRMPRPTGLASHTQLTAGDGVTLAASGPHRSGATPFSTGAGATPPGTRSGATPLRTTATVAAVPAATSPGVIAPPAPGQVRTGAHAAASAPALAAAPGRSARVLALAGVIAVGFGAGFLLRPRPTPPPIPPASGTPGSPPPSARGPGPPPRPPPPVRPRGVANPRPPRRHTLFGLVAQPTTASLPRKLPLACVMAWLETDPLPAQGYLPRIAAPWLASGVTRPELHVFIRPRRSGGPRTQVGPEPGKLAEIARISGSKALAMPIPRVAVVRQGGHFMQLGMAFDEIRAEDCAAGLLLCRGPREVRYDEPLWLDSIATAVRLPWCDFVVVDEEPLGEDALQFLSKAIRDPLEASKICVITAEAGSDATAEAARLTRLGKLISGARFGAWYHRSGPLMTAAPTAAPLNALAELLGPAPAASPR